MRYANIIYPIGIIDVVGAILAVIGIVLGGIKGTVMAVTGIPVLVEASIGYFTNRKSIGIITGAILGCNVGYFLQRNGDLYVGIIIGSVSGGIVGLFMMGSIGSWADEKKKEIDASLAEARSTLKRLRKEIFAKRDKIESMIEMTGLHGKPYITFKENLKHAMKYAEKDDFNENDMKSMENNIRSYQASIDDLDRITKIIEKRYFDNPIDDMSFSTEGIEKRSGPYSESAMGRYDMEGYLPEGLDIVLIQDLEREKEGSDGSDSFDDECDNFESGASPVSEDNIEAVHEADPSDPSESYTRFLSRSCEEIAPESIKGLLPKFHITSKIGSGTYAEVYRGSTTDGKKVAIKIPNIKIMRNLGKSERDKFLSGIVTWKKLDHRHLVQIYDYETKPVTYLVMELMEGGDLEGLMKVHALSVEESVHIMLQILEGMSFAHGRDVVHRNLDPECVLFTTDGTAKVMGADIGNILRTSISNKFTKKRLPIYSAPEQFDNRKFGKVDWQTDVFYLGILFYQMLTGVNPFEGDTMVSVVGSVLSYEPKPPSELNPEVPEDLDTIVMGALKKKKEERWKNSEEMRSQLMDVLARGYTANHRENGNNERTMDDQ